MTTKGKNNMSGTKTIALLTYGADDPNNFPLWEGVHAETQAQGINLICLPGKSLYSKRGFDRQANILYDLVREENVNGVIIWGTRLMTHVDIEKLRDFCFRFHPLPVINIGMPLDGIPSVFVDNYKSMYSIMDHLVKIHGYSRIAFIKGPKKNPEVEERYRAYRDVIKKYNIPFDTDLVVNGDWSRKSGASAISLLIDERNCDFNALVAANDMMALGVIDELQERNIIIPNDIAVVGFDNIREGRHSNPPLTTVRQAFEEYGRLAVYLLEKCLNGEYLNERYPIPLAMVLRQSCGCLEPIVDRAKGNLSEKINRTSRMALPASRESVISEVFATEEDAAIFNVELVSRLWNAFYNEVKGKSTESFLSVLDIILRHEETSEGDIFAWQNVISSIRRNTLPHIQDNEVLFHAEDLCNQARAMIGERALRALEYRRLKTEQQAAVLNDISQALGTTSDIDELMYILAENFPRLKLPSCCISLYENPIVPTGFCKPILMYQDMVGQVKVDLEVQRFPSWQLLPDFDLLKGKPCSIIVEPLYFQENHIGLAVFEVGPREWIVYETLRGQLSSALWGTRLVQYLQSLYESSTSILSLQEPQEILQDVVDRACKAVGAQSANVALVDEHGRPRRLTVGGDHKSSLDTSTLNGDTAYALKAIRTNTPVFIEDTHSSKNTITQEMLDAGIGAAACFPLFFGGRAIGVMWVYYEKSHSFSNIEITALRLYVNQAVIAYNNARRMKELKLLHKTSEQLASVAEIQEVLQQIADSAYEVFQAESVVIWPFDPIQQTFIPGGLITQGVSIEVVEELKLDKPTPGGIVENVIREKHLVVTDLDEKKYDYLGSDIKILRGANYIKSFQAIALKVGTEKLGVLCITYRMKQSFDDKDKSTLETFAYHSSLALQKARLLDHMKMTQKTAKRIAEVSVDSDKLLPILETIVDGMQKALHCSAITLYVYNPFTNRLDHPPTMVGVHNPAKAMRYEKVEEKSIVYEMLRRDKPYIVERIEDNDYWRNLRFVKDEKIVSCMAVPLKIARQDVGVIFVNHRKQHHFRKEERADIEFYAHQASEAIRNAQLYDDANKKAAYLQRLNEAGNAITGTLALDKVLDKIAEKARMFTGYDGQQARFCHIDLVEDTKLRFKTSYPPEYILKLKERLPVIDFEKDKRIGITGRVAKDGKSKLVDDVKLDPDYIEGDPDTCSELTVPIKIREKVIGIINVEHPSKKAFDDDDQSALEALAAQAAIAIQNAQQYEAHTRTKGLVGARTALAWMGMTSSAWRHTTGNQAQSIVEQINLLHDDLTEIAPEVRYPSIYKRLVSVQESAIQIKEKPITPPLSIEEGTISVAVNELVKMRTKQLQTSEPYKSITTCFDFSLGDEATVRASPEWLRRAIDIIIDNAVEALKGALIKRLTISTNKKGEMVEIRIIDTGKGIPENIRPVLFQEPIKKSKGAEGLGMGLLIAHAIIHTYDGEINVEFTSQQGTTMLICLPIET